MSALYKLIEACLLVAMGTFMAVLSQSNIYWQFINPKYSWLTLVSGVVLTVIGFASLLNHQKQRKVSEFLGVLVFLFLAGTAVVSFGDTVESGFGGSLTSSGYESTGEPSVTLDGVEYIKINGAELLLAEKEGAVSVGQPYAVQGAVIRSPKLDEAGYIGLGRLNITCCFADSIGVLTLVRVSTPDEHVHGTWVRVLGELEEGVPIPGEAIVLDGTLTGVRSDQFSLRAVEIAEQPVEGVPFIFEVKEQAPYAY